MFSSRIGRVVPEITICCLGQTPFVAPTLVHFPNSSEAEEAKADDNLWV